jgi:hypothetical protein
MSPLDLQLRIHKVHYLYISHPDPNIYIYADLLLIFSQLQGSIDATWSNS